MKALSDSEVTARLAHIRECIHECEVSHSPEELEAAQRRLKEFICLSTPIQQSLFSAGAI